MAVEECVTPGGIASAMHRHASADFADWRMTHRSLGACAPKRFSAQGRRWVGLLGTTGLPVGLHALTGCCPNRFHPPTQETTDSAVEECVTLGGIASAMHLHASADFAEWRMTHRSLGACVPKRFSAQVRRWVGLLGTTGLPVGLHELFLYS